MVAKITVPLTIHRALNYNEQKVAKGTAKCLYAHRFLKEAESLHFSEKITRFQNLIALNKRASTNTLHISLNFALEEKLDRGRLVQIASAYMEKIGFGEQPYLVYQHTDAGHPHLHLVTTNIQSDGKRISLHNIGRDRSEKARKELEILFGLQQAEKSQKQSVEISPVAAQKVLYGKGATKRGITTVLDAVLPHYHYASLAELNAVLRLYNVMADRGEPGGWIHAKGGLLYHSLDAEGKKIGVPIKASSIYSRPTLAVLEEKFKQNAGRKEAFKKSTKARIDWALLKPPKDIAGFKQALEKEKLSLVIRQNEAGVIYGLTYIDHHTMCVFNGSDLGKTYSAKAILQQCGVTGLQPSREKKAERLPSNGNAIAFTHQHNTKQPELAKALDVLITPIEQPATLPFELKKSKKKKRRPH